MACHTEQIDMITFSIIYTLHTPSRAEQRANERSSHNLRHYCGLFAFAHAPFCALCISSPSQFICSLSQHSLSSNYFVFFIYRVNLET